MMYDGSSTFILILPPLFFELSRPLPASVPSGLVPSDVSTVAALLISWKISSRISPPVYIGDSAAAILFALYTARNQSLYDPPVVAIEFRSWYTLLAILIWSIVIDSEVSIAVVWLITSMLSVFNQLLNKSLW